MIEQLPGESDASIVARRLGPQLEDLAQGDASLVFPVIRFGPAYILMIGPHTDDGFCWCQPEMVPCTSGRPHSHPIHVDKEH